MITGDNYFETVCLNLQAGEKESIVNMLISLSWKRDDIQKIMQPFVEAIDSRENSNYL